MYWACCCVLSVVCSAGVGTRNYYRKMGYESEGPYMVKDLYGPGLGWSWTTVLWLDSFYLATRTNVLSQSFFLINTKSFICHRIGWTYCPVLCFPSFRGDDVSQAAFFHTSSSLFVEISQCLFAMKPESCAKVSHGIILYCCVWSKDVDADTFYSASSRKRVLRYAEAHPSMQLCFSLVLRTFHFQCYKIRKPLYIL